MPVTSSTRPVTPPLFTPATLLGDLLLLAKPRIILLLVITCVGAMFVATEGNLYLIDAHTVFWGTFGLALSAAGANMVNMWYDRDIDIIMERTRKRPLPQGRMHPLFVLGLGIVLGIGSALLLWWQVNLLTAEMAAAGYLFYVLIYTFLLKRRTVQNIVIGGAAGAFPPLVGWAAVQGHLDWLPWGMFLIIFLWTPPHFWALALKKCADYTHAGVPMMPVVRGDAETKAQIVYYLLLLVPVTLALPLVGRSLGMIYFLTALVLGAIWLYKALRLMYAPDNELAMDCFKFSLTYLALLFGAMVLDTFV